MPLQERLGPGVRPAGRVRLAVRRDGPPAAHRRRARPARHRRPPGPQLGVAAPRAPAAGPVRPTPPAAAEAGPQRCQRVVRQQAGPDQVPDRGDHGVVARRRLTVVEQHPPGAVGELAEEQGATPVATPGAPVAPPARGRREPPAVAEGRRSRRDPSARARRARPGAAAWRRRPGSGSGRSRSATSVGASASHPSTPASAPQPVQLTSPAAVSSSSSAGVYPGSRAGRISDSSALAGSGAPASCSTTPRTSSAPGARRIRPRRPPGETCTPCQAGRNRPSARCSTGSTSDRSRASEARRSRRRTSASQYSVPSPWPPLRRHRQGGRPQLAADQPPHADQPVQHARDHRDPEAEPGRRLAPPGTARACARGAAAGRPADPVPAR